jgi:hypothetical protein
LIGDLLRGDAVRLSLLLAAAVIFVRDPTGKWAGDPLHSWFEHLRNQAGRYCCAEADGHPLDDGEWDMKGNGYRVLFEGKWAAVPDEAVILGPNKFGKAIVWFDAAAEYYETPNTGILCFMPGSGV